MKDFINIFISLLLVFLFLVVTYMINYKMGTASGILYLPIIIMMFMWGHKLYKDY